MRLPSQHRLGGDALVTVQVWLILRSRFPGLRAAESLASSVPFFLLLFAATYVVLAAISAANFGQRLWHTDGFGDLTAKTQTARLTPSSMKALWTNPVAAE